MELQLVRGEEIGVGGAVEEHALFLLQVQQTRGRPPQLAQPVVDVEELGRVVRLITAGTTTASRVHHLLDHVRGQGLPQALQ